MQYWFLEGDIVFYDNPTKFCSSPLYFVYCLPGHNSYQLIIQLALLNKESSTSSSSLPFHLKFSPEKEGQTHMFKLPFFPQP
jgi:hypothetical protein